MSSASFQGLLNWPDGVGKSCLKSSSFLRWSTPFWRYKALSFRTASTSYSTGSYGLEAMLYDLLPTMVFPRLGRLATYGTMMTLEVEGAHNQGPRETYSR